jgi:hypothetical protein
MKFRDILRAYNPWLVRPLMKLANEGKYTVSELRGLGSAGADLKLPFP